MRTDLSGRLTGWYRFKVDGKPVPAGTRLRELDPEKSLVIYTVPNTTRMVDLTVEGQQATRFMAPMGMAVPVVSLVDHITAWLGLPAGEYSLVGPDGPLGPHSILADLPERAAPLAVVLRVSQTGESK